MSAYNFGGALRIVREVRGITQTNVADAMQQAGNDWHACTVSKTESGARPLRASELCDLASIFDIPAGSLIGFARGVTE